MAAVADPNVNDYVQQGSDTESTTVEETQQGGFSASRLWERVEEVFVTENPVVAFKAAVASVLGGVRTNGKLIEFREFLAGLKERLQGAWDDRLVPAAEAVYERVQSALKRSGESGSRRLLSLRRTMNKVLGPYEPEIVRSVYERLQVVTARVLEVAMVTYGKCKEAVEQKLQTGKGVMLDAKARMDEYVSSVRSTLGDLWVERLETPLRQLHAALDADKDGFLTLSDLLGSIRSAREHIQKHVEQRIADTVKTVKTVPGRVKQKANEVKAYASSLQGNVVEVRQAIMTELSELYEAVKVHAGKKYRAFKNVQPNNDLDDDTLCQNCSGCRKLLAMTAALHSDSGGGGGGDLDGGVDESSDESDSDGNQSTDLFSLSNTKGEVKLN